MGGLAQEGELGLVVGEDVLDLTHPKWDEWVDLSRKGSLGLAMGEEVLNSTSPQWDEWVDLPRKENWV